MTVSTEVLIAAIGALVTAMTTIARFVYLDLRRDRDYWRGLALKLLAVNDKAIDVAQRDG